MRGVLGGRTRIRQVDNDPPSADPADGYHPYLTVQRERYGLHPEAIRDPAASFRQRQFLLTRRA
jgi:hypothetical protein